MVRFIIYLLVALLSLAYGVRAQSATFESNAVKWHPGHYITLQLDARDHASIQATLRDFSHYPAVQGLQIRYTWAELEPERGHYDFRPIERDLSLLAAQKKHLFVLLQPKSFARNRPSLPAYIFEEGAAYQTGAGKVARPGVPHNIALWTDTARDRFSALVEALGKRFNAEPYFEGIAITETALSAQRGTISEKMERRFFENLTTVHRLMRATFPNTVTLQFINFPERVLPWFVPALEQIGAGIGGPDTFLDDPSLLNGAYTYYPNLAGKVPLGPSVQPENYRQRRHGSKNVEPTPMNEFYVFDRDRLHANYIFWTRVSDDVNSYRRLIDFFDSAPFATDPAGGLQTSCPSAYRACAS